MKTTATFLFILFCFITVSLKSQDAPVTTIGIITDATTAPGAVVVPVTVKDFVSIGAFTLTIRYQANLATYISAAPHTAFTGLTITPTVVGTVGKIIITWPQTPGGVTLPDETHLLDLTFTFISGNAALNWFYQFGNICQYKKYSGGSYIVLNDNPKTSYYINGGISNRGAPITSAPTFINPSPGLLAVPITVDDFISIAAMTLNLEYNQNVLSFQSCTPNGGLLGSFYANPQMGPNGKMLVTISWISTAGPKSLDNGSTVVTIYFNYSTANGSCSSLDFYETGSSCEYADASANAFFDSPTAFYYHNGAVYTQYGPKVWLPVKTDAVPSGALSLPVFVNDFNNVRSFNLSFEYDPAVMTYGSFMPDTAFGSALAVTDSPSGSKRILAMSWTGSADKTLPDGHLVARLNFTYISGASPLKWIVTDGTSCRFNDASGNAYFDVPKDTYYQDGLVASHAAPKTIGGQQSAVSGQSVIVPVNVYDFTNIGLFSLALAYDPAVLTYLSASLVPDMGGAFTANTAGLGRIVMDWSGTATSLADSSILVNVTFTYLGGASPLAWYDDGNSCKFAESSSSPALYDQPRSFYYINGYVGPNPLIADFIANTASRDYDTTVYLQDMTTGGPTTWNWSISPSTYYFDNGTTGSSQNPQVKFTSNGLYTVTLIVSRGTSSSIRIRSDYMYIGTPGLWTGLTSGDWSIASNWHNFTVPSTSLGITIPPDAINWPHLTGNLTIGVLCPDITILDTAQLIVDGDFTINAGSSLTFTGAGTLILGGDWSNLGIFNIGTSTIDFTGTNDAAILGGASPETFYKITVSKTVANLSVQGMVHVVGTDF